MRHHKVVLFLVLGILLITAGHPVSLAQDGATTVTLTTIMLGVGESGVVEAEITCGTDACSAFEVTVAFDPAVIRVDSAEVGPYLGASTFPAENLVDNENGRVRLAATLLGDSKPTRDNLLFRIRVTALAEGLTVMSMVDLKIGDADGSPVPVTGLSGAVLVSAPAAQPTAVPTLPAPTPAPAPTLTPTIAPTLDPLAAAIANARMFSGGNADWEPVEQSFDGVPMMLVPSGCFMMGDTLFPDEQPVHRVCFTEPFWIDRYEVTNGHFARLGGIAGRSSWHTADNLPREFISWAESQAFCESRGARLPTEAEWEYAARGPDSWVYPWGNEWNAANAVFRGNSGRRSAEVGARPGGASWVGAMDLIGNVWEFVADKYDENYYATLPDGAVNPTGPASGDQIIVRGGSQSETFESKRLRAANRGDIDPGVWFRDLGFRCARGVD